MCKTFARIAAAVIDDPLAKYPGIHHRAPPQAPGYLRGFREQVLDCFRRNKDAGRVRHRGDVMIHGFEHKNLYVAKVARN